MEKEFTFYRKKLLPSTIPIQPGKKIELSSLDLLMENHHLKMVFYYKTPTVLPIGTLTTKLRILFAEVTSYFSVITGRLIRNNDEKWIIKCNDAGIRIVEAIAKGSVETWLQNVDAEKEKKLIHWEDMYHISYFWATFYVMVTEFEEGGMAIGLSCSHLLTDPFSATLLIKAWADRVLWGNISIPPFFHPLPKRSVGFHKSHQQPNNHLINHYKSILESPIPSSPTTQKSKTVALEFSDHMVQACIKLAHLNCPTNGTDPSPFAALVGILWVCISRVKGETTNGLVDMSMGLDMRKTLGLDKGYFGNCMIYTKVNGGGIGVDDPQLATKLTGEAIKNVNKEGIIDLVEWLDNCNNFPPPSSSDKGNLVFLNLENVDPYSTVFMDRYEPIRISYYNESSIAEKGKVLVLPSHPSEGKLSRIVMVTLPNNEAIKLCEDKLLSRFSPTIIMGAT
ncbi:protein ECERIFERUM 26-like [Spinacia oleracea]|uniref:Protein ECERIFERUM 26-like n=1 Tax=Spinacia oleracea TaxID=3562 RepID=A0A9R0IWA0_SPIOL|nr:protein ECERIFERUM 26-like [Spinacia oleracea]